MSQPAPRRLFLNILRNFINSLRPRQIRGNLIGEDYFGTKYYEIPANPCSERRKPSRWFEPKDKEDFQQELPAEWEAWLRGRRKEPPLEEEVLRNLELMKTKKINAAMLEEKAALDRPKLQHELKDIKGMESFPKYDEYEIVPGHPKNGNKN